MARPRTLIYGAGINDADYPIKKVINGKQIQCPYYQKWHHVLDRALSQKTKEKHPTYRDVSVCEEWLIFSNFKAWMELQDWEGKEIDKDIIVLGNKIYSPETCVFVDRIVNTFVMGCDASRGSTMIGVCFCKSEKKFKSSCSNPFTKKGEALGYFADEISAHKAWRKRKHELACQLADLQTDNRVANALRSRYI